jgi:lytic murein transglycosylase
MKFQGFVLAIVCAAAALLGPLPARSAPDPAFSRWLESLWPEAQAKGVSRKTFSAAIHGLEPDLSLPDLELPGRKGRPQPQQAEFVQTPETYVRESSIARLADQGKQLAAKHRATLAKIEQQYGVPASIILAIWGRETAYGSHKLPHNAIRVLATQGFYGRRKDMFKDEFLFALKILEEGHVSLANMRSSWGGAMGLTQFLPSEFFKHAVDFDGDGHRDIWGSVPDALASAAQQLVNKGWQRGQRWAYEVRTPAGVDCSTGVPEL